MSKSNVVLIREYNSQTDYSEFCYLLLTNYLNSPVLYRQTFDGTRLGPIFSRIFASVLLVYICGENCQSIIMFGIILFEWFVYEVTRRKDAVDYFFKLVLPEMEGEEFPKLTKHNNKLFVATLDNKVVGCVACRHISNTELELKRFAVLESARGHSIGTKLCEKVIAHAFQMKYQTIILDTEDGRYPARHIYEKFGFKRCPELDPRYDPFTIIHGISTIYYKLNLSN